MGVFVDVYTNRELPVEFVEGDIVFMNTFAVSGTTLSCIIRDAKANKIKKIFWYGHEATPKMFVNNDVKKVFREFLESDLAKIYAVSEQTSREYQKFFGVEKNIEKMPYRFFMDDKYYRVLKKNDFDKITFINTGSLMDMRKGQYPILYALLDFYHNKYQQNPDKYRDFKVKFIGAYDKSDELDSAAYHVKNIKRQFENSAKILGKRLEMRPTMSHEETLEEIKSSNVTLCYSMYEALPIFVYEGMAMGHPIIRNECPGAEEQIKDGINGIKVSGDDFASLVDAIEHILNKDKMCDEDLLKMSNESYAIAKAAQKLKYSAIDLIRQYFNN